MGRDALAARAVGTAQIEPGAITVELLDTNDSLQQRISDTCPIGEYFRGVEADGSILCEPVPGVTTFSDIGFGFWPRVAVPDDGLPAIAISGSGFLDVVKCENSACTRFVRTGLGEASGDLDLALAADGLPIISFQKAGDLHVLKCGVADCTSGNRVTRLQNRVSDTGANSAIFVPEDGLPMIVFRIESLSGDVAVAKCRNASCTRPSALEFPVDVATVASGVTDQGGATGIAQAFSNDVMIAWYDRSSSSVNLTYCEQSGCDGTETLTRNITGVQFDFSRTLSLSGLPRDFGARPIIVYTRNNSDDIVSLVCENFSCSSAGEVIGSRDGFSSVDPSLAIGRDGMPIVAYMHREGLRVTKCADSRCSEGASATTVDYYRYGGDPSDSTGDLVDLAIGADGLPIMVYQTRFGLRVARCGTQSCQ